MTRRKRLLVAPVLDDLATLRSLVARLGHYFGHVGVERIAVLVTPSLASFDLATMLSHPQVPAGFDPEVTSRIAAIASQIELTTVDPRAALPSIIADVMLFWDARASREPPWNDLAAPLRQNRTRFDIDWRRTRNEGSWFGEAAHVLSRNSRAFDPAAAPLFKARTENLLGSPVATLVATGPSARRALDVDMSGGVRIACNTTILDRALMDHVRPHIVTFADPIFHFGPSTYAYQFQRALAELADRQDFTVVTLERYATLLRSRIPQLAERIVGVRLGLAGWPQNYDLMRTFAVKPYPNILTMLMLPLAATFSRRIELFGFDGRDPNETYFWRHGSTVQFERELEDIKVAHPGFFQLDYADYYDQHLAAVEQMFLDLELRGVTVASATPSFMRPLRRRGRQIQLPPIGHQSAPLGHVSSGLPIVSLTPDWTGGFGHFGPWERAVSTAARAAGYGFYSLASRAIDPPNDSVRPTFTHGTLHRESADCGLFESELRSGIEGAVGSRRAMVCFYAADVWQLAPILAIAAERPTTTFAVNLMRCHPAITAGWHGESVIALHLLAECLTAAAGTNVRICLDTQAIANDLERATGRTVPVWPMIMLADPVRLGQDGRGVAPSPLRIVAPVHPQIAKGFAELVGLAERLSSRLHSARMVFAARFAPQPTGISPSTHDLADRFRRAGGTLVPDNLTDAQFSSLVGNSHVVVLPYRLATFRTRTSGVVLDAVAAGKPVITTRGTWAGDLVERYGVGTTFDDGSVDSLEAAMERIADDIDLYTARVRQNRDRIIDAHRPARVVSLLASLAAAASPPPQPARLIGLRALAAVSADAHWRADLDRSDRDLVELVRFDDLVRSRDDAYDQIQLLRTLNAGRQQRIDALTRA